VIEVILPVEENQLGGWSPRIGLVEALVVAYSAFGRPGEDQLVVPLAPDGLAGPVSLD